MIFPIVYEIPSCSFFIIFDATMSTNNKCYNGNNSTKILKEEPTTHKKTADPKYTTKHCNKKY